MNDADLFSLTFTVIPMIHSVNFNPLSLESGRRFLRFFKWVLMAGGFFLSALISGIATASDCVVLLHGLARGASSLNSMASMLEENGYRTVNISYPSRERPIDELAATTLPNALALCAQASEQQTTKLDTNDVSKPRVENPLVHFVTHSMGGIVLRQYLNHKTIPNLGRTVMLGPPNQGAELVNHLRDWELYRYFSGPAGKQLGTEPESLPNVLGRVNFDLGVIAGGRSVNLFLSMIIPGKDDGKVSVIRTQVEGMSDHIVVNATHPFMMKNAKVKSQTLYYLQHGRFFRDI